MQWVPTSVQWKRYVLYSHRLNFHIIFANQIVFTGFLGNLVRHYESIHEGIKRFHCDVCDRNFTQLAQLKSHNESVHQGIRYRCDFCSREFSIKGELTRHKKRVHEL